ncbi:MAG: DUF3301 domain-containing protein [Gammaproteobacteria bacterium]|nr:DUF3301 domain-containing protein [Gammaproteobacteria bacterium]
MGTEVTLFLLVFVVWFWWGGTKARENAMRRAQQVCERQSVQLLDGSVMLNQMRLKRDAAGAIRVARLYRFDFSLDGVERQQGYVLLLGERVMDVRFPRIEAPEDASRDSP